MDPNRMEMFELPNLFGHFIREFGVRWFCVIGAVVMAVIFGMRLSVALEPEPVQNPSGQYLRNDYGGAGTTVPEEKRYATEEAVRVERWVLSADELEDLPEAERTLDVVFYPDEDALQRAAGRISPSGRYFAVRTSPLTGRKDDMGEDPDRRIWQQGRLLVIYDGGNPQVEAVLAEGADELVADGREAEPVFWWVPPWKMFVSWKGFPDFIQCTLLALAAALFTVGAVRGPGKKPRGKETEDVGRPV